MEKLLIAEAVAPLAQLEVHAVYRYAREGKLPSIRIGSKVRFPETALRRFIENQLTGLALTQSQPAAQSVAA